MKYFNLDIDLAADAAGGESFTVRARSALTDAPLDGERAFLPAAARAAFRRLALGALDDGEIIALGKTLGDALFPPGARALLREGRLRLANQDDARLRIRVAASTVDLANVPWEFAFVPHAAVAPAAETVDGFLALDSKVCLLRREVIAGQATGTLTPLGDEPLRMVIAAANPRSQAPLNLADELTGIRQALRGIPAIAPKFIDQATISATQTALMTTTHIFHFSGHGEMREQPGVEGGEVEGGGALLFVDDEGNEDRWPAPALGNTLANRGIRLAVLSACESARRDGENAWSGVVPALMKAGVAAVVGMRFPVEDAHAIAFSAAFYAALAAGQPVEAALTEGRLAMRNRGASQDWGAPTLFLRAEEGALFPRRVGALAFDTPEYGAASAAPDRAKPDLKALRAFLDHHYDRTGLELLLAAATDAMRLDPHPAAASLEVIGAASDSLPLATLKIVRWFDQRGLTAYLVAAIRDSDAGRQFTL